MKTTVVCGLLGAGKTTFIKNHIRNASEKTVVLVNDFGAAGIDGEIFSAAGVESVELPSGCVCCTLKTDLVSSVRRIIEQFHPQHLVIEPSGVASPSGVLEALESGDADEVTVIGIVDVTEFSELFTSGMYGSFFEDQIVHSDVVLLNKTDIADEKQIVQSAHLIEAANPHAILFRTVQAEIAADALFHAVAKSALLKTGKAERLPQHEHFHFETLSYRLQAPAGFEHFSGFLRELASGRYGSVVRAKALLRSDQGPYRFDVSFGKMDGMRFEQDVKDSRLVIIGESLNRRAIEQELFGGSEKYKL